MTLADSTSSAAVSRRFVWNKSAHAKYVRSRSSHGISRRHLVMILPIMGAAQAKTSVTGTCHVVSDRFAAAAKPQLNSRLQEAYKDVGGIQVPLRMLLRKQLVTMQALVRERQGDSQLQTNSLIISRPAAPGHAIGF